MGGEMITWDEERAREYYHDMMKGEYTPEEIDAFVDYLFKGKPIIKMESGDDS